MFEKILEKVLVNVLGPYIEGIDINNLKISFWSGQVSISQVSLKPEALEMLNLPLKMKYSSIGNLSISIPWKNLGSKPIEIVLEDLHLILELNDQESWKTMDFRTINQKLKMMDAFVRSYTAKLAQKQKEEKGITSTLPEDQSLLARLTEKAIDNIQITIRNIHLRFEDPLPKSPFALGATLDEIIIQTTNENWEFEFIDRTLAENKLLPMRKKLLLKNLGIYWESNVKNLFGGLPSAIAKQNMKDFILRDDKEKNKELYIINISAEGKLIHKNRKDPDVKDEPEFDFSLQLAPIDLLVQKKHIEDFIQLTEYLNEYQKFRYRAIKESQIQSEELITEAEAESQHQIQLEEFKMLFTKIRLNDEEEGLKNVQNVRNALDGPEQAQLFEELLMTLPDQEIGLIMKQTLKEIEKEKRMRELAEKKEEKEEKKTRKRDYILGFLWKNPDSKDKEKEKSTQPSSANSSFWAEEDMKKIEKYIEESFPDDSDTEIETTRNILKFSFLLEGGTISLSNTLPSGNEEGISFEYKELTANGNITSQTKTIDIALNDLSFNLKTKYKNSPTYINTHIIRRVNYWLPPEKSGNILSLNLEINPMGREHGTFASVKAQRVEIVYRKALIDRLQDLLSPAKDNEAFKSQALDLSEGNQEIGPKNVKKEPEPFNKLYIEIDIDAPVIVVPLLQNGDVKSECWVLNLGHFVVGSKDPMTNEGLIYDLFEIGLTDIKFCYYPSQILYSNVQKSLIERRDLSLLSKEDQEQYKKTFNLIEQFSIKLDIKKMLPGMENTPQGKNEPKMHVDVTLPIVHMQLRRDVFQNLLKINELIDAATGSDMELIENEKEKLLNDNSKTGHLYVREKKLKKNVWTKCFCILKGSYLYLFKESDEQKPSFTYYIRNAVLSEFEDTEKEHAFDLKNKYNQTYLAAEDEKEKMEWLEVIVDKIDETSVANPNIFSRSKSFKRQKTRKMEEIEKEEKLEEEKFDEDLIEMKALVKIEEVKLTLIHPNKPESKLIELNTRNFHLELISQHLKTTAHVRLESLEIEDYLFEFTNPNLKRLATSLPPVGSQLENADLIEIHLVNIDENHPRYDEKKTNVHVEAKFGYLYLNLKPDILYQLMKFFIPSSQEKEKEKSMTRPPERKNTQSDIKLKKQETVYTENVTNILLNLDISLKEVGVRLIHMKNHMCLAEVALTSTNFKVRQKLHSLEFEGILGNIQLFDTTNYPQTIDSNLEYEKIRRTEIIGVGEPNENLVEVSFLQYDPEHPEADNKNFIQLFADVKVGSLRVNYIQKPVLRLIDYIQYQILPAVSNIGDSLEPMEKEEEVEVETVPSEESAQKTLLNPQFLNLKVSIKSPVLMLKPLPDSTKYWEVKLGDVYVENRILKDTTRFRNPSKALDFIYCQKFDIKIQNIGISRIEGPEIVRLTRETNFDLMLEIPMFAPEYNAVYSQPGETKKEENKFYLDERITLRGKMTPLITILEHEDLLFLMDIINSNLTYDDGLDSTFEVSHQDLTSTRDKSKPKEPEQPKKDETPFTLNLTFENFTLLALDKSGLPFSMINLHLLQVDIFQDAKGALYGGIRASELNGSFYEKTESTLTEKKMLGNLDRVQEHYISGKRKDYIVDEIVTSLIKYSETVVEHFVSKSEHQKNVQLRVNLDFQPNGEKTVRVDMNGLKAFLVPEVYFKVLEFADLGKSEESKEPKESKEKDQKSSEETEKKPVEEGKESSQEGFMRVEVDIRDILITVPASDVSISNSPHVLALRGDILCSFMELPKPTMEKALKDIEDQTFESAIQQCTQHNKLNDLKATLSRFEVFICEFEDLVTAASFKEVRKRNLILPFSFSFNRKSHLVPNKQRTELIPAALNEASMELVVLRMSYQDSLLLNNTIQYQIEQLGDKLGGSKDKKKSEEKEDKTESDLSQFEFESISEKSKTSSRDKFEETKDEEEREKLVEVINIEEEAQNKDTWEANLERFDFGSQGIQIVLINDAEGSLVPVIELTLQEIGGSIMMVKEKMNLGVKAQFNCSYFNPLPSKWEPIIEKFGIAVNVFKDIEPKMSVLISNYDFSDILNINVSEEMLVTLYSTIMTWKSDYERKVTTRTVKDSSNHAKVSTIDYTYEGESGVEIEDELIDYVSPYTIINQTGYPVQIETDTMTMNTGKHRRDNFGYSRSRSKKLLDLKDKKYQIENGGKIQYLIESNIEDFFKQSAQETMIGINHIRVKIKHPNLDIAQVHGIDIDRAFVTNYPLKANTKDNKEFTHNDFQLFVDVRLDKNSKVIILTSPIRITNKTHKSYSVLLEGKMKTEHLFLKPEESWPVPIDFIDGTLCIQTEGDTVPSLKKPIHDFTSKEVEVFELRAGSSYVIMESVKKDPQANFFEISLKPTFLIKNCCALDITYRITADVEKDPSVKKLKPQETQHEGDLSTKNKVFMQLRVPGFLWSKKIPIHSGSKHQLEREITVQDATGNLLSIFLFCPEEEKGTQKFFLYTKACIINETPYDLKYFIPYENRNVQVPGQLPTDADVEFNPKVILVNETKRLMVNKKGQKETSGEINVASVGSSYVELWHENEDTMLELGLDMKITQCDKDYKLITKTITINPRYVFVNKTDHEIELKREGSVKDPIRIQKGAREPFQWSDWGASGKEKSISIKINEEENKDFWNWSKGLDISNIGTYDFMTRSNDKSQTMFIKTTVTLDNSIMYIVFEKEEQNKSSYKIRNDCPGASLRVYQEGTNPSDGFIIPSGSTIPWSWEFPNKKKHLLVDFSYDDGIYLSSGQAFQFDELNHVRKIIIPEDLKARISTAFTIVTVEGASRVLTFLASEKGVFTTKSQIRKIIEESDKKEEMKRRSIINLNLEVNFYGIGVSMITKLYNREKKRKERKETAYLLIRGLQFQMLDSEENTITQLRIKYLNLDNNTSLETSFPVLLTPTRPAELVKDSRNSFFDVIVSQKKKTDIRYFETIQFLLAETTIRGDGMFMDTILEMTNNVNSILKEKNYYSADHSIPESLYASTEEAEKLTDIDFFNSKFKWKNQPIPEMKSNIFIQHLVVNPIFLNASFQLKKTHMTENIFFLAALFANALGSAIVNLDNAPLKIKGFRLDNVFDSQEAIGKKILDKIKDDAAKSVLKVVGSLDIVGNPVGLFNNISTGVVDLVEKPIDGFLQGPLEGGKGILQGAGSLVKNTVSGTFNSIGKFTGSLASGVSNLSMDEEYLASREKARLRRPDHLGEGIYQGFSSLFKGVGYGFKGVVTQPMEGAEREGTKGFLKGTVKGFTGLVSKPVAGLLDAASKTAEGVKNTATMFDEKPLNNRLRFPRAFYGKEKYYRSYMDTDAEILWLLYHTKNYKYLDMSLISAFDVFPDETDHENSFILALSYEYVLCWDVRRVKLVWAFDPKDITKVNLFQDGMQVELRKPDEISNEKCVPLINCDAVQNEFIGRKLVQLKRQVEKA